jgi:hypothetical protein
MSDNHPLWVSEDEDSNSRSNEQIWNVFSQLLVPLVILMTFIVVAELKQYQNSINEIQADNQALTTKLNNLMGTDKGILAKRAEVQLIEAQRQKLLAAMWRELAERRGPNGLDLNHFLGHPDIVNMRGQTIEDPEFAALCRKVVVEVAGELDGNTLQPMRAIPERRASKEYIKNMYYAVLDQAKLKDPGAAQNDAAAQMDFDTASQMSPNSNKDQANEAQDHETNVTDVVVTHANRQFIFNEIAEKAYKIQTDLIAVQRGVVVRMYPAHLDAKGKELARLMRNSTAMPQGPTAEARAYFEYIQTKVRQSLADQGYYFLKATWLPVDKL